MKKAITDKAVKGFKPKEKPYEVRDNDLQGFLLRVQPTGRITFYVEYRIAAGVNEKGRTIWKKNRIKLGVFPKLPVPKARETAETKLAEITLGANPADEKREAMEQAKQALTLRQFLNDVYAPWARVNLKSHGPTLIRLKAGFAPLLDKRLVDLCAFDFEKHRLTRLKEKRFHPLAKGAKEAKPRKAPTQAGVNRDQMTMRAALARAVEWKHMNDNPLDGVKKAKEDKNRAIRAMTAAEEADILDAFAKRRAARVAKWQAEARKGAKMGPPVPRFLDYFEPAVVVSVDCGLRRGETIGLLWTDVNFAAGNITVRGEGAKSNQTRVVPMAPRVHDTLDRWSQQTGGHGRVFPEASVDSIRAKWRVLLKDSGVKGLRWHDLRHTFGTRLAMAGVALPVVQRLMGHASITTTARYLHATDADARAAVELVANARKGAANEKQ